MVHTEDSVLLTDLYQLTMMQGYHAEEMHKQAVFEFFVRRLPEQRNFYVAAGLEQVLQFLENLHFTEEELDFLEKQHRFSKEFLQYLRDFKFTGEVNAMPEGTIFFTNEPILQIIAPLPQAQLIESRIINLLHYQTMIASKSVRCHLVTPDKQLIDFGMRRAHGAEAALMAARASYIAGFTGSATVLAAMQFGIPIYGTMAHSYIQAHKNELEAFTAFARAQPDNIVLLIDTYDTEKGAELVAEIAPQLKAEGLQIKAVRLDSGDLGEHARKVRKILDDANLPEIKIFASGDLDEYKLAELMIQNAPIDGFGIGTKLDTSADLPYLDCAYKLQVYADIPRRKRSEGKSTWPGRKQVYRYYEQKLLTMERDVITLSSDTFNSGRPLLQPVMKSGKRLLDSPTLDEIRAHLTAELRTLPQDLLHLRKAEEPYQVEIDKSLTALAEQLDKVG